MTLEEAYRLSNCQSHRRRDLCRFCSGDGCGGWARLQGRGCIDRQPARLLPDANACWAFRSL